MGQRKCPSHCFRKAQKHTTHLSGGQPGSWDGAAPLPQKEHRCAQVRRWLPGDLPALRREKLPPPWKARVPNSTSSFSPHHVSPSREKPSPRTLPGWMRRVGRPRFFPSGSLPSRGGWTFLPHPLLLALWLLRKMLVLPGPSQPRSSEFQHRNKEALLAVSQSGLLTQGCR